MKRSIGAEEVTLRYCGGDVGASAGRGLSQGRIEGVSGESCERSRQSRVAVERLGWEGVATLRLHLFPARSRAGKRATPVIPHRRPSTSCFVDFSLSRPRFGARGWRDGGFVSRLCGLLAHRASGTRAQNGGKLPAFPPPFLAEKHSRQG